MDALTLTAACIVCVAQPSVAANVARWEPLIAEASARFTIPETWIEGVMNVESGGFVTLNGKPIMSSAGAMGLMQVMPNTYAALSERYGLGADPYDPHDNILAGAAYLKAMYARYGYPLFFAAYLTGPTHLDDYLSRPGGLPHNVVAYVNDIARGAISEARTDAKQSKPLARTARNPLSSDLFFVLKAPSISPQPTQNRVSETPAITLKSVVADTDHPTDLFISLSSPRY